MQEGGTGFEYVQNVEKPLGLDKVHPIDPGSSDYVLETCGSGEWTSRLQTLISQKHNVGALVLIHGSVLHKSERNTSLLTRYAYTFHMIEAPPLASYDEKNWLQPTADMPFSLLFGNPQVI